MTLDPVGADPASNAFRFGKKVLIFGATGAQGGAVTRALRAEGWSVRAMVRDAGSAGALDLAALGVEVVTGDFSDPASVREAMADIYGVFSVQPSSGQGALYGVTDEDEIRYGKLVADLADELGVSHFVYTSVGVVGSEPTGMGHLDTKAALEGYIRGLNLRSTILRPATFMELLLAPGIFEDGRITFFSRPDQARQVIAVEDIGRIAAAVFAAPDRYVGRSLNIAGDTVTGDDLQTSLSKAAGRSIAYRRFADSVLAGDDYLRGVADLFDGGRLGAGADVEALNAEFGPLSTFDAWLTTTGRPLLVAALREAVADVDGA